MPSVVKRLKHPKYSRLTVLLRPRSRFYQAITFLDGRKIQRSLKTADAETALQLGESWYKKLLRASLADAKQHPLDKLATDPTIGDVYKSFRFTLTKARRAYCDTKWGAVAPFWRAIPVTDVTAARVREFYRTRRRHKTQYGDVPTNNTLAKDVTLLRAILKHAVEEQHLAAVPPLPKPGKIVDNPRPWLTRDEFDHLMPINASGMWPAIGV